MNCNLIKYPRNLYLLTTLTACSSLVHHASGDKQISLNSAVISKSKATFKSLSVSSATYNANNPSEDRMITDKIIKDMQCLSIFDGHGGWQVSDFSSQTIFQYFEKNIIMSHLINSVSNDKAGDISVADSLDDVTRIEESINDNVFDDFNIRVIFEKTFQDVETSYIM